MRYTTRLLITLVVLGSASAVRADGPVLSVPSSDRSLHVSVTLPGGVPGDASSLRLVEDGGGEASAWAGVGPEIGPDGSLREGAKRLIATIPPGGEGPTRRFGLQRAEEDSPGGAQVFRFQEADDRGLGLWERDRQVLVYNHGVRSKAGVPAARNRSTYVHPIFGLDGEVLTDDFPEDHLHHRGLFWAWPHVQVGGEEYDLWLLGDGIEPRFERWLAREGGRVAGVLGVENGWYVGDRKVMRERVWLTVHPAEGAEQAIDVACYWEPTDRPVTLAGAAGKSYGGLTLRFAPRTETVITTPQGAQGDDLLITREPWADLTARFAGASGPSGAAILVRPDHPDFPPEWLTRHYGALCVGWPGVEPQTIDPGRPVCARYRVWIHRGPAGVSRLAGAYEALRREDAVTWIPAAGTSERLAP